MLVASGWFVALLLVQTSTTEGFLLDNAHCDSKSVCSCTKTQVYCNFKSLSAIPSIVPLNSTEHVETYNIHLSGNTFTTVPRNIFKSFSSLNASAIHLFLDLNKISAIRGDAFKGIEKFVTYLTLEYNNLTFLPSAIGSLTALEKLYLFGNPITSFDAHVAALLGRSLAFLSIGMGSFKTWPFEIGQLQYLKTLELQQVPSDQFMPADSLQNLGSNLTHLQIYKSNLSRPPIAMCELYNLTNFIYGNNAKPVPHVPLFDHCLHRLSKLGYISLNRNHIATFPNVLLLLPGLKYLSLNNNNISSIGIDQIPDDSNITTFYLQHNSLRRVPGALKKLKQVDDMDLSFNHITTIGKDDFAGMVQLYELQINNNPIKHVPTGAFQNNINLANLNMEYTNVTTIPKDVLHLHKLYFLPYMGNKVVCNCSMSYLKTWNIQRVSFFTGFCNGDPLDQPLKQYILGNLQNCP